MCHMNRQSSGRACDYNTKTESTDGPPLLLLLNLIEIGGRRPEFSEEGEQWGPPVFDPETWFIVIFL